MKKLLALTRGGWGGKETPPPSDDPIIFIIARCYFYVELHHFSTYLPYLPFFDIFTRVKDTAPAAGPEPEHPAAAGNYNSIIIAGFKTARNAAVWTASFR